MAMLLIVSPVRMERYNRCSVTVVQQIVGSGYSRCLILINTLSIDSFGQMMLACTNILRALTFVHRLQLMLPSTS